MLIANFGAAYLKIARITGGNMTAVPYQCSMPSSRRRKCTQAWAEATSREQFTHWRHWNHRRLQVEALTWKASELPSRALVWLWREYAGWRESLTNVGASPHMGCSILAALVSYERSLRLLPVRDAQPCAAADGVAAR